MKSSRVYYPKFTLNTLIVYIYISTTVLFIQCDARTKLELQVPKHISAKFEVVNSLEYSSKIEPLELGSPFSLPSFTTLPPLSSPEKSPPYCLNPPITPQTPSSPTPTKSQPPPPLPTPLSPSGPNTPLQTPPPGPPSGSNNPSPPKNVPISPPIYLPPVVFPPPSGPTPPHAKPESGQWCVAKPAVPEPIMQEALDYACGSGADCKSIQSNGSCYEPNTLLHHSSFAYNSYWQNTKSGGGTCDFGGTAMLVTIDPSFHGCTFNYTG